jgi:hypothetical protein
MKNLYQWERGVVALSFSLLIFFFVTVPASQMQAQTCATPSYNLDQARNGSASNPTNPVAWVNGNLNASQSHFVEGYSVPYRVIIDGLVSGQCYCIRIEWDIRHSGVNALDYITSYPNCTNTLMDDPSHMGSFQHGPECVDPLAGVGLVSPPMSTFPIPAPTNNITVLGNSQPVTSFNSHPASERVLTMWNGTITSAAYDIQGSLTASQSATSMIVCFTATGTKAVMAWGGHIASRLEWGVGNSAGAISGSPYHMRILGSRCCSATTFSGGNQDRSLQAAAVVPAPIAIITGTDSSCVGGLNQHTITTNQPAQTSYSWTITSAGTTGAQIVGSDTVQTIQVSTTGPGQYIVCGTVTINGQSGSDCDTIDVFENPTCSITGDAIVCNGNSTTFTASSADSWLWSTGETTQSIEVDETGIYTVTITDGNGCSSNCDKPLTAGTPFTLDSDKTDVFCYGENTGAINLHVLGGASNLTFNWSNGATTEDISGLAAGTYTVTVTDPNGCSAEHTVTIDQPAAALQTGETHVDVSCNGGNDGSIDLTVTGGTSPYSYDWSNGSTNEDLSGLSAGNYQVVVTDFFNCTTSIQVTIDEPDPLSIDEDHVNVACNGGNDGSIDITVSGGTNPYSYLWNDGNTDEDRSGLSANVYTVVVTDDNGCTASETVTITQAGSLVINETHTNVSCNGYSDGSIDLTVSGGTPGYDFLWNDGNTSEDRSGLAAGTYTVTVTDANGCSAMESITITQPPLLTVSQQHTDVSCNGGSNGSINLTINGGTLPYSIDWNNGFSSQEDLSNLSAGTYSVVVTDNKGCTAGLSVDIDQPDELLISQFDLTHIACNGGATGAIDITVTGGTPAYIYSWNNGSSDEDLTGLTAGNYNVMIMDAKGCTVSGQYEIQEPDELELSQTHQNITCYGDDDGSIDLTVVGGTTPYTFQWNSGETSEDISSIAPGTYTVTVTDDNGCSATLPVEITTPDELVLMELHEDETCNESNNGSINLGIMGGTTPYSILWSNGSTSEDISGLTAGTYTVTVTDDNNCVASISVEITQPDLLQLSVSADSVSCFGGNDGSLDLTVSGGTTLYSYNWSNGETTQDISGLTADTYTVVVTDANQCSATISETVGEPALLEVSAQVTSSLCGDDNGAIDITVSGGVIPYSYLWSNTETTEDISNLAAGTYTVTVTDDNGCTAAGSWQVTDAGAVQASAVGADVTCYGGSDGSANLSVSGGTPPYTYLWSDGSTNEDLSGVIAGTYTVTVTDLNGCEAVTSVQIGEPSQILLEVNGYCSPCKKKDEAYATVVASGGTGILTYLWSNGETTTEIYNLPSGYYTVTVTDENGCTATGTVLLDCDPKCQYTTYTIGGYGSTPNGNNPGTYVHANFGNAFPAGLVIGCNNTLSLTSAQAVTDFLPSGSTPSQLPAGNLINPGQGYSNVLAAQLVAATLSVGFDDADPNFSPEFTNLGDQFIASGVFTGWTVRQLIDSANHFIGGCGSLYSASSFNTALTLLNENFDNGNVNNGYIVCPSEELDAIVTKTDIPCDKQCDGTASVIALEGTAPYSYLWSTGAITPDITGLCPGTYTVTVTDANGCEVVREVEIIQLVSSIVLNYVKSDNACYGDLNGSIDLSISGGDAPYQIIWSNGETTEDLSNLPAGIYTVTVSDSKGCSASVSVEITQPDELTGQIDPTHILCSKKDDGMADLTVSGGVGPYTYQWSNGEITEDISGLVPGTYTVTVSDANDCSITLDVTIVELSSWMYLSFETSDILCAGNSNGGIDLEVNGGVAPYSYLWSNGAISQDLNGVPAGTYTVTVTDANGCSNTGMATVHEPTALTAWASKTNPVCGLNGSINVHVSGGVQPYSFLWSNGETTEDISGLIPGVYTVTITDANGCSFELWKKLWGTHAMRIRRKSITHASDTVCDGAIDIRVWGGTHPLSYQWNTGATSEDLNNLCPGVYKVTVTDANGCTASKALRVRYLKDVNPVRVNSEVSAESAGVILGSVYPSPASQAVTVLAYFDRQGDAVLSVHDLSGKVVELQQDIEIPTAGAVEFSLDVSQYRAGTYIVKIFQNGKWVQEKFQIVR